MTSHSVWYVVKIGLTSPLKNADEATWLGLAETYITAHTIDVKERNVSSREPEAGDLSGPSEFKRTSVPDQKRQRAV